MKTLNKLGNALLGSDAKRSQRIYAAVSLLLLTAILFMALYYILSDPMTDSDYVEDVIWAQASIDSGRLLSTTFHYGYAMPLGGNVFMLPFVAMLGQTLFANRLGIVLFFSVLVFALLVLAANATKRRGDMYTLTAIALLAMFTATGANLLHHILYYGMAYISALGLLGCALPVITGKAQGKKAIKWLIGLLLWGFVSAANGFVQIALSALPVLLAIAVCVMIKKSRLISRDNLGEAASAAAIIVGIAAGLVFFKLAMNGVPDMGYVETSGSYTIVSDAELLEHLEILPSSWVSIFGLSVGGDSAFAIGGLRSLFRVTVFLAVTVSPVLLLCVWKKLDTASRLIFFANTFTGAVCLMEFLLTQKGAGTPRVLMNMLLCAYLNAALFFSCYINELRWKTVTAVAIAGITFITSFEVYKNEIKVKQQSPIIDIIKSEDLKYGFGGFWVANVNTVLSEGDVFIRSIGTNVVRGVDRGLLQTDDLWYNRPADADEFFLLLTSDELGEYANIEKANSYLTESCKRKVDINDAFVMLVYDMDFWDELFVPSVLRFGPDYGAITQEGGTREGDELVMPEGTSINIIRQGMRDGTYTLEISGEGADSAEVSVVSGDTSVELRRAGTEGAEYKLELSSGYNNVGITITAGKGGLRYEEAELRVRSVIRSGYDMFSPEIVQDANCDQSEEEVAVMPGGSVSGPNVEFTPGSYLITVTGRKLENADIEVTSDDGAVKHEMLDIVTSEDGISFRLELKEDAPGLNITVRNPGKDYLIWRSLLIETD